MTGTRKYYELWTGDDENRLRSLWADGKTGGEIQAAMGFKFTKSAIIGKANRMGLAARKSPIGVGPSKRFINKHEHNGRNMVSKKVKVNPNDFEARKSQLLTPTNAPKPMVDLGANECRYPIGGFKEPAKLFCACKTFGGVYCDYHADIAYTGPSGEKI